MKHLLFLGLAVSTTLFGAVERRSLDLQLPTQALLERQVVVAPGQTSATALKSAYAGPTSSAAVTLSSFSAQPDVPRNIVVAPNGGTSIDCAVTVSGTNFHGDTISEVLNFTNGQSSPAVGNAAFKTVTSVAWAANCEQNPFSYTWNVGYGEKLGLRRCMDGKGDFFQAALNGDYESTRPTLAFGKTQVEFNTVDLNSSYDGTDVWAYYRQNFRCNP